MATSKFQPVPGTNSAQKMTVEVQRERKEMKLQEHLAHSLDNNLGPGFIALGPITLFLSLQVLCCLVGSQHPLRYFPYS